MAKGERRCFHIEISPGVVRVLLLGGYLWWWFWVVLARRVLIDGLLVVCWRFLWTVWRGIGQLV